MVNALSLWARAALWSTGLNGGPPSHALGRIETSCIMPTVSASNDMCWWNACPDVRARPAAACVAATAAAAAGNGGFLGATGTEVHVGEVAPARMAQVFERVRLVYFCPAQKDGSIIEHAICPFGGEFKKETLLGYAGIKGDWDIAEVRHPQDPSP